VPRPVEIIKRTDTCFVVQPKRRVIEGPFAWACINRRLARDVERADRTVKALLQVAMIKLMPRRIARYRGTSRSDAEPAAQLPPRGPTKRAASRAAWSRALDLLTLSTNSASGSLS